MARLSRQWLCDITNYHSKVDFAQNEKAKEQADSDKNCRIIKLPAAKRSLKIYAYNYILGEHSKQ
jgi:hypothetical protein